MDTTPSKGQVTIITPVTPKRKDRKLFCDGPAEWLQEHQLHFCRRGIIKRETGLSSMLMMIKLLEVKELRMTYRSMSMYTIGNLVDLMRSGASCLHSLPVD